MIADDKVRGASRLPSFHKERKLNFEEFRFVFIDTGYLKYLRGFDPEIFFSSNTDYSKKAASGYFNELQWSKICNSTHVRKGKAYSLERCDRNKLSYI